MPADHLIAVLCSSFSAAFFWLELGRLIKPVASLRTRYPEWARRLFDLPEIYLSDPRDNVTDREIDFKIPRNQVLFEIATARVRQTEKPYYKAFYRAINYFTLGTGFFILSPYLVYGTWDYSSLASTAAASLMFLGAGLLLKAPADLRIVRVIDYIAQRRNAPYTPAAPEKNPEDDARNDETK